MSSSTHSDNPMNINGSLNLPYEVLQSIFLNGNRSRRTIAKLSRVCRHWRSIINQTIELWTTIKLFSRNSKDLNEAFRRIEWLVQRTRRDNDHNDTNNNCKSGDGSNHNGEDDGNTLFDVIWDPSQLSAVLDPTTIMNHFLLLLPPKRWRSLYVSVGEDENVEILENHLFDNLEEINIPGSRCLSKSMARLPRQAFSNLNLKDLDSPAEAETKQQSQARDFIKASSYLKTLAIREYDNDLFPTVNDLQLIGPQTHVHIECDLFPNPELYRPFFNQVRHLHIRWLFYWTNSTMFQHITHLHVQSLNPWQFEDFRLSSLTHFHIDKLLLYMGTPGLTLHLPSVECIRIQNVSDWPGRFCAFDAPSLQKLHLGRPDRRLLEAFKTSPYTHLSLGLHIYWDKALQLVRPYLGQLSSLHLICGAFSVPYVVFPLFDAHGENNGVIVGASLRLRISIGRRRLFEDESTLEEPACRFYARHALDSMIIDWIDGSELKIER